MTGRLGRRGKQPLNELNAKRRHWDYKEEESARTLWRTSLDRSYGSVARKTRNDGCARSYKSERALVKDSGLLGSDDVSLVEVFAGPLKVNALRSFETSAAILSNDCSSYRTVSNTVIRTSNFAGLDWFSVSAKR